MTMNDDKDPERRGESAVAVSVLPLADGKIRSFFDDLRRETDGPTRVWRHDTFTTHVTIDAAQLKELKFDRDELANFGLTVLGILRTLQID